MQRPYLSAAGYFSSDVLGYKKGMVTPDRTVEGYELELFVNDYEWGRVNGETIPYRKNTLMIFRPGDVRCSKLSYSCYYIHLRIRDAALCDAFNRFPRCQIVQNAESYIPLFQQIAALYPLPADEPPYRLLSDLYTLFSILSDEQRTVAQMPAALSGEDAISIAKAFLNEHLCEHISLSRLAAHVHLSPNYFHSAFTRVCGLSPLAYLTQIRMAKARFYLMTTAKTVSEIADLCGFSTCNYFCSRFKSHYGVTPVAFRKQNGLYRL